MEKVVKELFNFYNGKKVLITGHTGFKGSWLSMLLKNFGAEIIGYSLNVPTKPSLFELAKMDKIVKTKFGDVRNYTLLKEFMDKHRPEIIFHLAAQPLVIESYNNPLYTYETNILGTLNILEATRNSDYVKSIINVTTDKVYKNNEWIWGYREDEELDGFDPYSNSKSCSELITKTYKRAFFSNRIAVSTVRAGNVIGGGDFSENRIIPDCMRSLLENENISIRNPKSIRPYQHVLEPLMAYILIAYKQSININLADHYNVGPNEEDCVSTKTLVKIFIENSYKEIEFVEENLIGNHEANYLKLDNAKLKKILQWKPRWDILTSVKKTIDWIYTYEYCPENILEIMYNQINEYLEKE